jgi:hypothetical protein
MTAAMAARSGKESPTNESALLDKLKDVRVPYHVLDFTDSRFTDDERRYLERQLRSMFAFVGCEIPETVNAGGTRIPLRDVVWRLLTREALSEQEAALVRELVPVLDRKVRDDKMMIEQYDLTDEEAEKLYFEACGMLKALLTVQELDRNRKSSIGESDRDEKVKDARRLLELIKKIM